MPSEKLASAENALKGNLASAWNILEGSSGDYTDLGIARRFGGAAAAYSLRDIGAMNGSVVRVRRIQDNAVEDFSALQVASGSIEKFAIGQDVLDLYNNAAYFPTDSDYFSLGSGITLSGAFTISYDVVFTGSFSTNTSRIFQDDIGNDLLTFTASNVCKFRVGTTVRTMPTLSTPLELGRKYSMIFARDGSGNYTLTIDGVQVSSVSSSDTDDFLIQRIGFRNRGSISNLNINSGQHIYAGDGAENSNWLDTGSGTTTNATKVGTPVAFTGQGIDAFVDTWFDQSGNSRPLIQATMTEQPLIIEDGSLLDGVKANAATSDDTMQNLQVSTNGVSANFGTNDWASGANSKLGLMYVGKIDDVAVSTAQSIIWGGGRGVSSFQSGGLSLQVVKGGDDTYRLTNERQGLTPSTMTTTVTLNTDDDMILYGTADNREFTLKLNSTTATETEAADLDTREDQALSLFGAYSGFNTRRYQNSSGGVCKECYLFAGDNISEVDTIATEINQHYNIY